MKSGFPAQVQFVNEKKPALEILKLNASTQKALMGAKFKVTKVSGELVGEYSSDANGLVRIEGLEAGSYIITEIRSPDGYILDITPQTVQLDPGKTTAVAIAGEDRRATRQSFEEIKKEIKKLGGEVEALKDRPRNRYETITIGIILAIIGLIVGVVASRIGLTP